jgi:UDP-N-acetylglucosamine--N-acetylmuramyl-(pentapeptide) pyrophosphoryl-undecaprenol N-acetylglucosamine transferase
MILVAVGASQFPFDRLVRAVASLATVEPVVVQCGVSTVRPTGARCVDFLPMGELAGLARESRAVVTHAGVGSILLALANGRRPYVVPRRRRFGETVDDHQLESARRFAAAGLVTLVEEPAGLVDAVAQVSEPVSVRVEEVPLVRDLRAYIEEVVAS